MQEYGPECSANMRAVDTNLLVRLIVRDQPEQVTAAETFVAPSAWVSMLVLMEAVWVLESVYRLGRSQIATVVAMLLEHDRMALQDEDVVRRAQLRFEQESAVGFSDCLIMEVARKAGHLPLGTFDRALGAIDGGQRL